MQIDPTSPITLVQLNGPHADAMPASPGKSQTHAPNAPLGESTDRAETRRALQELAQAIEPFNISLKFTRDEETGTIVIQMINEQSGETLKQIPNQASLHVAATLSKLQGKLFNCKA